MSDEDPNILIKSLLTVGIGISAIPGLIIEPGPISEFLAIGAILTVWGYDFDTGGG